jgi:cellulose biosynthesis protein BcsQ
MKYTFWNNKGGTGKSSLAFQTVCEYALQNPTKKILAIDLCPQANLSELFMGGLLGNGGNNLSSLTTSERTRTIGGYFQDRLSNPFNVPDINANNYISNPNNFNNVIPNNVELIAGYRIVELQANSISALSITQIPGVDTYLKVIDWLNDLVDVANSQNHYDDVFIDTNPSFAIYTQIALAAGNRIIAPVMADDSSRRALINIFSLVYGINLPSPIYNQYAFNTKLANGNRALPKLHLVVKNRLTQYMGPASAYASVLQSIDSDINNVLATNPSFFTFSNLTDGLANVRDFQTTGVVAFAKATPFSKLAIGTHNIFGKNTQIQAAYLNNCIDSINEIVNKL